jgi:hypothetical protein
LCSVTSHSARGTFSRRSRYLRASKRGARDQEMSDTYIIEVRSKAAGIVVRDLGGYRFFAATHHYNSLEGRLFRNAREAEHAAIRLASGGVALMA